MRKSEDTGRLTGDEWRTAPAQVHDPLLERSRNVVRSSERVALAAFDAKLLIPQLLVSWERRHVETVGSLVFPACTTGKPEDQSNAGDGGYRFQNEPPTPTCPA